MVVVSGLHHLSTAAAAAVKSEVQGFTSAMPRAAH